MRSRLLLLAAGAAFLAACKSPTSPSGGGGHSTTITVGNNFFSPTPDTVTSGSQVTWTWVASSNPHTVNWDSGPTGAALPPNSGQPQTSGTYFATLTTIGSYNYHCSVHTGMTGVMVVK